MITVEQLTFSYRRGTPIIENWSGVFEAGEIVALTGRSGRGKSTLLYLLGLMLAPDSGRIVIDGREVTSLTDAGRSRIRANEFGFVFQDAALDPTRTVLDNVIETALYRSEPRKKAIPRAEALMKKFQVELRSTHKPGQISGGQAQRIALCRALLHSPKYLFADEPTGNLDRESAGIVVNSFQEQAASGSTVIVASHDPYLIGNCTREVRL